jgi:hypothetical protein
MDPFQITGKNSLIIFGPKYVELCVTVQLSDEIPSEISYPFWLAVVFYL